MKRWIKRILKGLAVLVGVYIVLFILVFSWQMISAKFGDPDADLVDRNEQDTQNRHTDVAAIVESVRKFITIQRTPEYQRDAHAKAHGCVRARFEVPQIESRYNHGIFKKAGTYEAWVRFSNGSVPTLDDPKKDARGMAIKVMDVDGEQLLPDVLAGRTQDFVMIDSPAFFIRKISDYRVLERLTADGRPFTYFLGPHYLNPFRWKLRELYLGLGTRKKPPATPLSTQYYSMSPYALGPHQVKYSAKACEPYTAPSVDRTQPNFLRATMKKVLRERDVCFQFMVQIRDPEARMPIEDTTVVWSEKKSPFVPVARVQIPRQEFDTAAQNDMCESLSFNPWHGVVDMKPLSYINEMRRELYLHTAAFRRVRNAARLQDEPSSWCDALGNCPVLLVPANDASAGDPVSGAAQTDEQPRPGPSAPATAVSTQIETQPPANPDAQ